MNLYSSMAIQNIKKNHRFFIPRILTEGGLLGCYYIVYTLYSDKRMRSVYGGGYLPFFMAIGIMVVALLSVILMLYTNSFLMKQRTRELGLYNVLGLEKRHVGKILFFESAVSSLAGIVLGLLFGTLFYKICSLFICRLLNVESVLGFYFLTSKTLISSAVFFLAIDLFTYFVNLINLARMKPVELIASAHTGEREPKVKWLMLIIGIITLGLGYFLAIVTKNPISALPVFFLAVLLVIIGTYFLFVTGTTFVLKRLKANKAYYYNKKHMTSVSGLLYRMKQNAVGLASICILSTGVLVLISTTVSLYSGMEQMFDSKFKQELYVYAKYRDLNQENKFVPIDVVSQAVQKSAEQNNVKIQKLIKQRYLGVTYKYENGKLTSDYVPGSFRDTAEVIFITEATYKECTGATLNLKSNEIAFCNISSADKSIYDQKNIQVGDTNFEIAKSLNLFPITFGTMSFLTNFGVVVSDDAVINQIYDYQRAAYEKRAKEFEAYNLQPEEFIERLAVKFDDKELACAAGDDINKGISSEIHKYIYAQSDFTEGNNIWVSLDSLWETKRNVCGMYGTFLFLGVLLGIVFLFATTLIIYYKQISEGYEDQKRFQIMEKIGMSQDEVKGSIKNQILLVFFLPLVVAGIHICFAFPLLNRLLNLLLLPKISLFVLCTTITFLVFAFVYVVIYSITAKTYYKIVH